MYLCKKIIEIAYQYGLGLQSHIRQCKNQDAIEILIKNHIPRNT